MSLGPLVVCDATQGCCYGPLVRLPGSRAQRAHLLAYFRNILTGAGDLVGAEVGLKPASTQLIELNP